MGQIILLHPVCAPPRSIGARLITWVAARLGRAPRAWTADELPDRLRRDIGLERHGRTPGTRYHDYPSPRWR